MRKAIGLAPYYLVQAKNYEAEVYLKGSFIIKKIPKILGKNVFSVEGNGVNSNSLQEGKTYTSESMNHILFSAPDSFVHTVKASRNSFPAGIDSESAVFGYINASLYDSDEEVVISPLSPNAMRHYKFRYEGFFDEGKYTVNKIKVTPKRKSQQLFDGYIYIVENLWNIHSVDLSIEPFFGKIKMKQQYSEIKDKVWLPINHIFNLELGMMGVKANVDYAGTVKYLSVNLNNNLKIPGLLAKEIAKEQSFADTTPAELTKNQKKIEKILEKEELSNRDMVKLVNAISKENKPKNEDIDLEIKSNYKLEIKHDSIKYDSLLWNSVRPIPLTIEEQKGFAIRDSLDAIENQQDSTTKKPINKFRRISNKIIRGGNFTGDSSKVSFSYGGLIMIDGLGFNPVDGWKYRQDFGFVWKQDSTHRFDFSTKIGYAFARRDFYGNVRISQTYSPLKRGIVSLSGNMGTADFNPELPIRPIIDMGASLLFKENYSRYFDNKNVEIKNLIDLTNGLQMEIAGNYQWAAPLENNTNFSFFWRNKNYHPNEVLSNPTVNNSHFMKQEAFIMKLKFSYTPRQYYHIQKGKKRMLHSDFPTFAIGMEQGIKAFSSTSDYLKATVNVFKEPEFSLRSTFSWDIDAGWFIRNNQMHFSHFHHFNAATIPLTSHNLGSQFLFIDSYAASTNKWYVKANGTFSTPYLLLKYLPVISNTLCAENLHVGYLHTPDFPHYTQIGYSVSRIFMFGSIGVFAGFSELKYRDWGIKMAISLP